MFGSGLNNGGVNPVITISGKTAPILAAFPFQVNAQMPESVAPGEARLQVSSQLGTASGSVTILPAAPGIFLLNNSQGAIVNQDGTVNGPSNPAPRGSYVSVYCTGLGATAENNSLQSATTSVGVVLNGLNLQPSFSGLTPGLTALYQVNFQISPNTPRGTMTTLSLVAGGQKSNTAVLAIE